ncbi:MAG: hypothetical protein WCK96_13740 [Methylococcales bacterium]
MKQPLVIATLLVATLVTIPVHAVEKASEQRLDEVVERGSHVMPFDLEQTTHVFSKTEQGGCNK